MIIYELKRTNWMDETENTSDLYETKELAYKAAAGIIIYELLPEFLAETEFKQSIVGFIGQLLATAKKQEFKGIFQQWKYLNSKYNVETLDKLAIQSVELDTQAKQYTFNSDEDLDYIGNWLKNEY